MQLYRAVMIVIQIKETIKSLLFYKYHDPYNYVLQISFLFLVQIDVWSTGVVFYQCLYSTKVYFWEDIKMRSFTVAIW